MGLFTEDKKKQDANNRIGYIDGLRGLAALMVITVHVANFIPAGTYPNFILSWMKLGRYGVQMFYVISAYTILASLERLSVNRGGVLCLLP